MQSTAVHTDQQPDACLISPTCQQAPAPLKDSRGQLRPLQHSPPNKPSIIPQKKKKKKGQLTWQPRSAAPLVTAHMT